jgi:hypothetical protein
MTKAGKMSEYLKACADMLQKQGNQKSQNCCGKGDQMDMETLIAILRMIQKEQNIRAKTKMLEKNRKEELTRAYKEKVGDLSAEQFELKNNNLAAIIQKFASDRNSLKLLKPIDTAMDDSGKLLKKPSTGKETVAAETEVIERLAALLMNSAQSSKSLSKQEKQMLMAMLKMMMMPKQGKGAGKTPGHSTAGGFTNDPNMNFSGKDFKRNESDRSTDHTGGKAAGRMPEEFKSAIEAFHRKIQKTAPKGTY